MPKRKRARTNKRELAILLLLAGQHWRLCGLSTLAISYCDLFQTVPYSTRETT